MKGSDITKTIPQTDFTLIRLFESGDRRMLDMNPHVKGEGIWAQLRN
jgi:hypothetical protein